MPVQPDTTSTGKDPVPPPELQTVRTIIFPLNIGIDPMERLLVADFSGDPEFSALEPQVFNDPVNGKGIRVLRYRHDNLVDVYWQPGVHTDRNTITIGAGIGDFAETIIEPARFECTDRGVDLHVAFTDLKGRRVELKIQEKSHDAGRMPLLAPVGSNIDKPLRLFLVYMLDFDFVQRKGTVIHAKIGDRMLTPATFPLLRNFHRVWLARYASRMIIGTFNPPMTRPSVFDLAVPGSASVDGMNVSVDEDGTITWVRAGGQGNGAEVGFLPGFPNLADLADGAGKTGRWTYRIAGAVITGGSYSLERQGDRVFLEVDCTEHWRPSGIPFGFRIFMSLARFFHTWPATYRWKGIVTLGKEPALSGAWERKRGT